MDRGSVEPIAFVADGGLLAGLSASPATITVQKGKRYLLKASGVGACVRFGGVAAASNGNFDFVVLANEHVTVTARSNSLSCVESETAGAGTLYVAEIDVPNSG